MKKITRCQCNYLNYFYARVTTVSGNFCLSARPSVNTSIALMLYILCITPTPSPQSSLLIHLFSQSAHMLWSYCRCAGAVLFFFFDGHKMYLDRITASYTYSSLAFFSLWGMKFRTKVFHNLLMDFSEILHT